jgi:hypothetical protein
MEVTTAWWSGAAPWDAQQSARSAEVRLKASAAPLSTSGTAWNGFAEERKKAT